MEKEKLIIIRVKFYLQYITIVVLHYTKRVNPKKPAEFKRFYSYKYRINLNMLIGDI